MDTATSISGDKILSLVGERQSPDSALDIDIIADIICPWSRIGVSRLQRAMESVHGPVRLGWFPFQLNPDMPDEGMALDAYLAQRFGDKRAIEPALDELARLAAHEGAAVRFDLIEHVPNTFNAHCLIDQAANSGTQTELALALYDAFFARGEDIGDADVLRGYARAANLSDADIDAALNDRQTRAVVAANEATARHAGVTGVPDFLINQRVFVVGAQEHEQLVNAIDRAMFGDSDNASATTVMH